MGKVNLCWRYIHLDYSILQVSYCLPVSFLFVYVKLNVDELV